MAVQYEEIKKLRSSGKIPKEWTASDIKKYVDDGYPNQTRSNHSACPCHKEKGYHCTINTKSHRFVRLGAGKYCLIEESPPICPIHNVKSNMNIPSKLEGKTTRVTNKSERSVILQTQEQKMLSRLVSNLKEDLTNNNINVNSVERHIKNLSDIGFQYDKDTYPMLSNTETYLTNVENSPNNLAEALLWKLGKWSSYKNFVQYYEGTFEEPIEKDLIFFAFAKHLKDNNDPIFDQHTLRSMWAVDTSLTSEERLFCKKFLMNNKEKWKQSGSGSSGMHCYNLYKRFIIRVQKLYNDIKKIDRLLMPLGQALKKNTQNYNEFFELCDFNN